MVNGEYRMSSNMVPGEPLSDPERPLILLVDDFPQNVQILHQMLDNGDYSFAIATNGEEVFRVIDKKLPDLILLDVMLGDMDGFDVCKRLKSNSRTAGIPIIFLTARTSVEDKVKGFKLGAVDYITKPFEDAEVLARVHTHVQLKKSMDMIRQYNSELTETIDEMQESYLQLQEVQQQTFKNEAISAMETLTVDARHEINQPLTVIQGYLGLLKDTMGPANLDPLQKKYLDRIESALEKLIDTLQNFRNSSRSYFKDIGAVKLP